jgi:siroheme synthase-like protein
MFYPIYLNLKGKRVVVVGGGEVAERKVESLLGTEASIAVISPKVTVRLESLAGEKRIQLCRRAYAPGDCAGTALVLSATDDPELSRAVFQEAAAAGALVNTADQPALCDFIMPAVVRRGSIAVAISTGGASPGLAARLRRKISRIIGPEYALMAEFLADVRPEIRRRVQTEEARKELHYRILDSDIMNRLKHNDAEGARRLLQEIIQS